MQEVSDLETTYYPTKPAKYALWVQANGRKFSATRTPFGIFYVTVWDSLLQPSTHAKKNTGKTADWRGITSMDSCIKCTARYYRIDVFKSHTRDLHY